jgi:hypothetical protein
MHFSNIFAGWMESCFRRKDGSVLLLNSSKLWSNIAAQSNRSYFGNCAAPQKCKASRGIPPACEISPADLRPTSFEFSNWVNDSRQSELLELLPKDFSDAANRGRLRAAALTSHRRQQQMLEPDAKEDLKRGRYPSPRPRGFMNPIAISKQRRWTVRQIDSKLELLLCFIFLSMLSFWQFHHSAKSLVLKESKEYQRRVDALPLNTSAPRKSIPLQTAPKVAAEISQDIVMGNSQITSPTGLARPLSVVPEHTLGRLTEGQASPENTRSNIHLPSSEITRGPKRPLVSQNQQGDLDPIGGLLISLKK